MQNVFDTKQLPFRILLVHSVHVPESSETPLSPNVLLDEVFLVAVGSSLEEIKRDWQIAQKLATDAAPLDKTEVEAFFMTKIQSIVAAHAERSSVDEAAPDEKFRQAARSFRRLAVSCYILFIDIRY